MTKSALTRRGVFAAGAAGLCALMAPLSGCTPSGEQSKPHSSGAVPAGSAEAKPTRDASDEIEAADGSRADGPITFDWEGRWDPDEASIDFDEDAQTCTVTVDYEPAWFETCEDQRVFSYQWTPNGWTYQPDASPHPITYESIVGTYKCQDSLQSNGVVEFTINSVDENGAVEATATWAYRGNNMSEQVERTIDFTGTIEDITSTTAHQALCSLDGTMPDGNYAGAMFLVADDLEGSDRDSIRVIQLYQTVHDEQYGYYSRGETLEILEEKSATR